jgi:HK97 family phage prohead protease
MQTKRLDAALAVKAVEADGTFSGYGSVFDTLDSYKEVVARGAFKTSLSKWSAKGRLPPLLWQHDQSQPIGIYTKMEEDEHGLRVEGRLLKDDVRQAAEAYALLKAGALSGLSIGFFTKADAWDDKRRVRTLSEIDLVEISLVTVPANPDARIESVKAAEAITTIREFEGFLREHGFSNAKAKAIAATGFRSADAAEDTAAAVAQLTALLTQIRAPISTR